MEAQVSGECYDSGQMPGSRFSGVEWQRRGMCYAVLGCICGTRWHSTENQIRALQQLPAVLSWWCIRGPSLSEMTEQQSPRQQKDPHARKCSFFFPLSFTAYWRQNLKKKKTKTRWELSHPFQEVFPYTGVSVGGLGHYSNFPNALFGSLFASQLSQSCLTAMIHDYTESSRDTIGKLFSGSSAGTIIGLIIFHVNDTLNCCSLN